MRVPKELLKRSRSDAGRALARLRSMRVPKGSVKRRIARARPSTRLRSIRVPARFVKRGRDDLGRAMILALVLLAGGGEAAMLALLPPDAGGSAAPRAAQAVAPATAAPTPLDARRSVAQRPAERRAGPSYYRRTRSRHVPAAAKTSFMPLYREAQRSFNVSWRLIASVHRQETAFSTEPSTYRGLNAFGCCAGPMQFNVTNGPPSTWALYRQSFRHAKRPRSYPHRTRKHPSIYDDFDAIMAAGALLSDSGATTQLDGASWSAAYAYYGHDLFGVEYASEVLGRAKGWERGGFCLNCPVDDSLVAEFDDAFGVDARRGLLADEERDKKKRAKAKKRKQQRADRARRRAAEKARQRERATRPTAPAPERGPTPPQTTPAPSPEAPAPPQTPTTTPQAPSEPGAPPPPAEPACTEVSRLLGCRD